MGLQNAAYNGKVTNQVGQREKELCVRTGVDKIIVHLMVQCISNSKQQRFWISHDTDYRFSLSSLLCSNGWDMFGLMDRQINLVHFGFMVRRFYNILQLSLQEGMKWHIYEAFRLIN